MTRPSHAFGPHQISPRSSRTGARFEADRRLHAVPDLRLALGLAAPHRHAERYDARDRRRAARRRHPVPPAARRRSRGGFDAPPDLPRPGSVRLQRAAARAGFLRRRRSDGFAALWRDIRALLQATPALRHDTIALEKMPETIGAQPNPLLCLDVQLNPSGAYETALGADWEHSTPPSAPRRRAGATAPSCKRLGELGEVRFVDPDASAETRVDARHADRSRRASRSPAWASPNCSRGPATRHSSASLRPRRACARWFMSAGSMSASPGRRSISD